MVLALIDFEKGLTNQIHLADGQREPGDCNGFCLKKFDAHRLKVSLGFFIDIVMIGIKRKFNSVLDSVPSFETLEMSP